MKLSRDAMALFVVLLVCILVIILLTPIGFETRPQSDLKTFGYVAIGTIFTGLTLFLLSIGFLFRRVRLASSLAIIASILFFIPIIGDRAGAFFSLPIPPAINMLEYLLVVVLFATLYLASRVYRKSTAASKQPMDSGKQTRNEPLRLHTKPQDQPRLHNSTMLRSFHHRLRILTPPTRWFFLEFARNS